MGRTWVLDTETKGTGAHMVPLERTTKRSSSVEPVFVPRPPARPREPEAPAPTVKTPHTFRIVDVQTRRTLADGASTREAVDVLRDVRSLLDVNVYTWDPERDRWRLLAVSEQRAIWDFAHG
jgi:hypothetical protein